MDQQYKAVFFDLGGTLRIALHPEAYERHARRKLAELSGTDLPFETFYQLVEERYEPYRKWALEECKEAGDEELWCNWLLPDFDPAHIRPICHELSYQYRQSKGYRVIVLGDCTATLRICWNDHGRCSTCQTESSQTPSLPRRPR